MLKNVFQIYLDEASSGTEICVAVSSIETGEEIAVSYDVVADISEYGELVIYVSV